MTGTIVDADAWIHERADAAQAAELAGGSTLRLFQNNFTPTPASVVGDFLEATFASYLALDLAGHWGAAAQVVAGEYQAQTDLMEFISTDPVGQNVYGWYITNGGGRLNHSGKLPAPVLMIQDQILRLRINYQTWAIILI